MKDLEKEREGQVGEKENKILNLKEKKRDLKSIVTQKEQEIETIKKTLQEHKVETEKI
jgi:hypothetical protein